MTKPAGDFGKGDRTVDGQVDIREGTAGAPPRGPARLATVRSYAIVGLFVLACLYTLYFAAAFLIPIFAALFLYLLLSPAIRFAARRRVPPALAAAMVLPVVILCVGFLVFQLAQPATKWVERTPYLLYQIEEKLRPIKKPVEDVKKAAEEVEKATDVGGSGSMVVKVEKDSLFTRAFGTTRVVILQLAVTLILALFLLSTGDMFKQKLVGAMPTFTDKKRAVSIWRQIESDVSNYLATITLINIGFGAVIALIAYAFSFPNPILWGAVAAVLNFVPYFGVVAGVTMLLLVGLVEFDALQNAVIPAALYALVNVAEGTFLTPAILGRRLTMNPVVIFVSVTFWGWIWGIAGAVMAVPVLVCVKVFLLHIDRARANPRPPG